MNDNHPAGGDPWSGLYNKQVPSNAHRLLGWEPEDEPAAEYLNFMLNRYGLRFGEVARMYVSNWSLTDSAAVLAGYTLGASCHHLDSTGLMRVTVFFYNTAANSVVERLSNQGILWSVPASSPVDGVANAFTSLDADADDIDQRMVAINGTVGDRVRYAVGYGAGAWGNATIAGAPALNWQAIGCDRNTAGGANARWLIGDDAGGGNGRIFASTAGTPPTFNNVAGFPAIAEPIIFIGHTTHPAGALGPQDPGNPSWLVLTTNRSVRSANGTVWTNVAHSFAGTPSRRCAAYSRTSGRWVVVGAGAALADLYYSDDLGASWASMVGALAPAPTGSMSIACDGYGTFVIDDSSSRRWVSTDEGASWTCVSTTLSGTAGVNVLEVMMDEATDVDQVSSSPAGFVVCNLNNATPLFQAQRTLVY